MILRTLASCLALAACSFAAATQPAPKPKLVVAIIVDQFRYDYLTRFRSEYHGGFDRMMTHGADFTNAFYAQIPTVTAVGHSMFMSGAMPALSGIVGNAWYDRDSGQIVTSVCDWNEKTVGGHQAPKGRACTDADPASPQRLEVSTIGDELRDVTPQSKVIGISIKSRASILPSGHRAQAAYWFDDASGNFVTSTFYMDALPSWVDRFNNRHLPQAYVKRAWPGFPGWIFEAQAPAHPYSKLAASPWGNELIEGFAEHAITAEQLGRHQATDLLTVSFSSNDYVGHAAGPDSAEVHDMAVRTDALLGKLFHALDQQVGLSNVLIVLSADHGVAPLPDQDAKNKMPGGYDIANLDGAVASALTKAFGKADWIIPGGEGSFYFDWAAISKLHGVTEEDVYRVAKRALLSDPQLHVARVYSRTDLERGVTGDFVAEAAQNGFNPRRSGDLTLVLDPYFVPGRTGTSHFSPYNYDRHVPVLFMGPGIKPGRYDETIRPNDIAATLATMLAIQTPSGSSGRVLTEMLTQ